MKARCLNRANISYSRYGGRGITVCDRWLSFDNFLEDMGHRPPAMQLDRINNAGNYQPGNCRWASRKQQCRNKSTNRLLSYKGQTKLLREWCEETGIHYSTAKNRLDRGYTLARALASGHVLKNGPKVHAHGTIQRAKRGCHCKACRAARHSDYIERRYGSC